MMRLHPGDEHGMSLNMTSYSILGFFLRWLIMHRNRKKSQRHELAHHQVVHGQPARDHLIKGHSRLQTAVDLKIELVTTSVIPPGDDHGQTLSTMSSLTRSPGAVMGSTM